MANDPQTFDELKVAVLSWSARDDLSGNVEEFIALAERRINAALRVSPATTTLSATSGTVALPADCAGIRGLWLNTPRRMLSLVPLDVLLRAYSGDSGTPEAYTVEGTNLLLGPEPSTTTTLNLSYWQGLDALNSTNTTNWLLTAYPDLYLSACLVELYLYIADEQATLWEQRTAAKIDAVNRAKQAERYSGPLVAKARATG